MICCVVINKMTIETVLINLPKKKNNVFLKFYCINRQSQYIMNANYNFLIVKIEQ